MVDQRFGHWYADGKRILRSGFDGGGLIGTAGGDFYDDGRKDARGFTVMPTLDTHANAILMAAAPELLAALKMAVDVMQDHGIDESMAGEFEMFINAINKAERGGE